MSNTVLAQVLNVEHVKHLGRSCSHGHSKVRTHQGGGGDYGLLRVNQGLECEGGVGRTAGYSVVCGVLLTSPGFGLAPL